MLKEHELLRELRPPYAVEKPFKSLEGQWRLSGKKIDLGHVLESGSVSKPKRSGDGLGKGKEARHHFAV
ncbi:hypothetical protein SDC9_182710 [bioreactor metagenome]|uniref:Uncharacterized protein n=1 Tax=bioreactor metagenome TaxID=1076179 RepID=A0A645HHR6_9ZZZZ